ncbi:hypothetical protein [Isoptericola variabilis]|uniref:V8-like Glu-specific endopeptidase n=1 Tax=Isoptericola variabilis (strain 225) TaxID=743718 RepID=F6FRQ1_ISOV2|nr:hypothetical protein [Isoptericola variabilis]AEG42992.1 V8-like Glu-specific endopeptidase [Isoptericola variabilis 225]TWH30036.1 hypothetical protein L600_003300000020 [Isoptericola variabilis J7]
MTRLVLVHGRDTGGLDADELETRWLASLNAGLAASGSELRLHDDDASFVYFGDTLAALVREPGGTPPPITVHALARLDLAEAEFALAVAHEVLSAAGAPPEAISVVVHDDGTDGRPSGALGDAVAAALAAALAAIDRYVPGVSGAFVLLLAHDVHTYLHDAEVRAVVDDGVAAALPSDEPALLVAHSFGSVVAYEVLRAAGAAEPWDVALLCTLGSPLAIRAVLDVLRSRGPLHFPPTVGRWVAVRDPRDLLTLHDLDPATFPHEWSGWEIQNVHVDNRVPGRHAATTVVDGRPAGYLAEPAVARLVADALGH